MKATDLMVKCLEAEGVDYIFGIPGEENIDLMDSLSRSSISFVLTRHEQAAAFMADVYGRLTGKPGVCLATLGPGATNLITGVANAQLDRSPLIAITGQAERTRLHKESHQNIDTVQVFKAITKYDQQVLAAETIPEIVRKAFNLATRENPGAIHISLPVDTAKEETNGEPPYIGKQAKAAPNKASLREAATLIAGAKDPIILAGNGVIRGRASEELKALVQAGNLPAVHTFMAKGILPFEHELNLFTVGGQKLPDELRPLLAADLIIAVGFDLVEYDPKAWNSDRSRRILHIHAAPSETDEHYPVALEVIGDLRYSLMALTTYVEQRSESSAHFAIRRRRLQQLQALPSPPEQLPQKIMQYLSEQLPPDAALISDVGLHKLWVSRWYQPKRPGQTIIFNGLASMGVSLPGAIGARLARPDAPVVVVSGDGGFMMNSQELETAKRLGLAFTIIVFNDKHLSLIEKHQQDSDLAVTQISFTNPDFALYAQSFGIAHRSARTPEEFSAALEEAVNSGELNLLEIIHKR
ncbi:acetolactate synthase large subunit [Paenibacillus sp. HB172176]|uniref:acetolactate synthase large subunit n=1 Tax=Paenibacillus sp. HB172176 TaxID=2493690 RepID=UPI00143BA6ED|nr:acetolactate synthase large subunit [Paenibacillus sp. HB172176]